MTLFENTLSGQEGVIPNEFSLAISGDSVVVESPIRSIYSSTRQVHDRNTISLTTGKHRAETPRFIVEDFNDLPFSVRWYCWFPEMPSGNGERRWIARFREHGLVAQQTSYGNLYLQFSPMDIAAEELEPEHSGTARPMGQWLRVELQYTSSNSPVIRVFSEHETDVYRQFDYSGVRVDGGEFHLTGYRYRRRTLIQWGSSGSAVEQLQRELISIGYLPSGSDDGVYGDQLFDAISEFQEDHDLSPVDGAAGNETRAAIDIVRGQTFAPIFISHLAFSDGDWIGPAPDPLPPLPDPDPYPLSVGLNI